mmetsp:Transcript_33381/g.98422  ORF Transcript_33381/g.98422 Transcript_33381/m.98422 type:complete len:271 (+) Transcript_33381:737-1549(+)
MEAPALHPEPQPPASRLVISSVRKSASSSTSSTSTSTVSIMSSRKVWQIPSSLHFELAQIASSVQGEPLICPVQTLPMLWPERQQIMLVSLGLDEAMAQAPERQSDTDSQDCSPGPRQTPEEQTFVTQSLLLVQRSLLKSSRALSTASLTPSPLLSVKRGASVGSVPSVPAWSSSKSLAPSLSVSGSVGSVPIISSRISLTPSMSTSLTSGLSSGSNPSVPALTSCPSEAPSRSESGWLGSVPASVSAASVTPSLSLSGPSSGSVPSVPA